jgi:hypothetical protein
MAGAPVLAAAPWRFTMAGDCTKALSCTVGLQLGDHRLVPAHLQRLPMQLLICHLSFNVIYLYIYLYIYTVFTTVFLDASILIPRQLQLGPIQRLEDDHRPIGQIRQISFSEEIQLTIEERRDKVSGQYLCQ